MAEREPLGRRGCFKAGKGSRGGGAEIGAYHCGGGTFKADDSPCRSGEGNSDSGTGRLGEQGGDKTDQNHAEPTAFQSAAIAQIGAEACGQPLKCLFEQIQPQKKQAKASQCIAQAFGAYIAGQEANQYAESQYGERQRIDFEAKAQQADQPCRDSGAEIGAKDHANGLAQVEHPGVDKAKCGNSDGAGGLHQSGDQNANPYTAPGC